MGCGPIHVALAASGVAYTSCGGNLFAIGSDGVVEWKRDLTWVSPTPLQLAPDGGVIAIVDHGIEAFDPSGATRWKVEFWRRLESDGIEPRTVPVQPSGELLQDADGTLYVGTQDNGVYAIAADGSLRWNFSTRDSSGDSGYVTQLAFLDDALLVNASRLIALPAPGARRAPISGVPFHESHD
jgi:outer membrane protein assembly factor BamB